MSQLGLPLEERERVPMLAYASRTGTRANLDALRVAGWRLIVSARGVLRTEGFPYALDNGAWTAHQRGEPLDEVAFGAALDKLGADADFVVVPDVVGDWDGTRRLADIWLPRLRGAGLRRLVVAQDGATPETLGPYLGFGVGVFVGGSTRWKEASAGWCCALARARGAYAHVGRVNTMRRIKVCAAAGADSFDGSGVSRFAAHLVVCERARAGCAEPVRERINGVPLQSFLRTCP